jgi:hypothetical protein
MRGRPASLAFPAFLLAALLLSGCSSPASTHAAAGAPDTDAVGDDETGIVTTERTAEWAAGVNAGVASPNFLGSGNPVEHVGGENLTGVIVEMAWTASSALSETMALSVAHDGEDAGSVSGTSPLRLEFPGGDLAGDLILYGHAEEGGAYADQSFTLYVSSFHGVPFDPSFSAVPA